MNLQYSPLDTCLKYKKILVGRTIPQMQWSVKLTSINSLYMKIKQNNVMQAFFYNLRIPVIFLNWIEYLLHP